MERSTLTIEYKLKTVCPDCDAEIDLSDQGSYLSNYLFKGQPGIIEGCHFICPECEFSFEIGSIEEKLI